MANNLNDDILIYPYDLNTKRYIALDFYAPEFSKDVINSLVGFVGSAATLDGKGVVTAVTQGADAFVKIFDQAKDRFSVKTNADGTKTFSGDLSKQALIKNANTYKGSIFLPLSNSLSETVGNNYDAENGTVSNILSKVGLGADGAVQATMNEISKFTGTRTSLVNADTTQLYKGSTPRALNLDWTFLPSNQDEADQILEIVRTLKKFSSPETQAAKALLLSPYLCTITFNNKKLDDSLRYEGMVIRRITVSYGSGGSMEMFSDGMVKEMNVSIEFAEIRMKTMEDWLEKDSRKNRARGADFSLDNLFGQSNAEIEEEFTRDRNV